MERFGSLACVTQTSNCLVRTTSLYRPPAVERLRSPPRISIRRVAEDGPPMTTTYGFGFDLARPRAMRPPTYAAASSCATSAILTIWSQRLRPAKVAKSQSLCGAILPFSVHLIGRSVTGSLGSRKMRRTEVLCLRFDLSASGILRHLDLARFDGLSIWQSGSYWVFCCQLVVCDGHQLFGFFPVRKLAAERTPLFLPKLVCACSHSVFNISHRAAQTSVPG
jgi:hypothetical protein